MSQKILTMLTKGNSLRHEAEAWSGEDSNLFEFGKPIGLSPGLQGFYCFKTPLEAMANGWKLMGPPTVAEEFESREYYDWWFEKT